MRTPRRSTLVIGLVVTTALAMAIALAMPSVQEEFSVPVWDRESPLKNPISVVRVADGTLTLSDGRAFRPAGVVRKEGVSAEGFDLALRVMTAQGVMVRRDFGDGRALLWCEPKFSNTCGTCARQYSGSRWKRWAGSCFKCPLSELLIRSGYANADLETPGLRPIERWRLKGVTHFGASDEPERLSENVNALRYDWGAWYFAEYDDLLESMWQPPPAP